MSVPCEVIRDLLPLYYDEVCSKESGREVLSHLAKCEECRKEYEKLCSARELETAYDEKDNERIADSFKKVKRRNGKRSLLIASAAVLTAAAAAAVTLMYYLKPVYPEQKKPVASAEALSAEIGENKLLYPKLDPLVYQKEEPEFAVTLDGTMRSAKPTGWVASGSFTERGAEVDWTFECIADHCEELEGAVFSDGAYLAGKWEHTDHDSIKVTKAYSPEQNMSCSKYVYHSVPVYSYDEYTVNALENRVEITGSALQSLSSTIIVHTSPNGAGGVEDSIIRLEKKDANKLNYHFNYNGNYYVFKAEIEAQEFEEGELDNLTESVGRQMRTVIFDMIP